MPEELFAPAFGLDEVHRDDGVRVVVEEGLPGRDSALEPRRSGGENQLRVDVELRAEFLLPLLGKVGRAEHSDPRYLPAIVQFASDQAGLDRLADAYVVGDQETNGVLAEGDKERDELVRTRLEGQPAERTEGARPRTKGEAHCVAEQAAGSVVAKSGGVRGGEGRRLDLLELAEDAGRLIVGATEGSNDEEILGRLGEDHPLAPADTDETTGSVAHLP
jgi:hypothetical protein